MKKQRLVAQEEMSPAVMEEMCPDVAIDLVLEAKKSVRLAGMSTFQKAVGEKNFVYCNTGGRASLSGKSLEELGFSNVTVVDMKLTDWIEAGFPIEESQ